MIIAIPLPINSILKRNSLAGNSTKRIQFLQSFPQRSAKDVQKNTLMAAEAQLTLNPYVDEP